jgi:hypothetical protein
MLALKNNKNLIAVVYEDSQTEHTLTFNLWHFSQAPRCRVTAAACLTSGFKGPCLAALLSVLSFLWVFWMNEG